MSKRQLLNEGMRTFLDKQHSAAMTTLRRDGTPHTARVGVAVVDGKVWSSATQERVRTKHLRRDTRATLFVFDTAFRWLTLECRINILDGADAPQLNLKLFRVMQRDMTPAPPDGMISWFGANRTIDEFLKIMVDDHRLIYEFEVERAYGMYADTPSR